MHTVFLVALINTPYPGIRLPFTTQQFIQLQDMHSPYGQSDQGGI